MFNPQAHRAHTIHDDSEAKGDAHLHDISLVFHCLNTPSLENIVIRRSSSISRLGTRNGVGKTIQTSRTRVDKITSSSTLVCCGNELRTRLVPSCTCDSACHVRCTIPDVKCAAIVIVESSQMVG